jgi:hypothetical protein
VGEKLSSEVIPIVKLDLLCVQYMCYSPPLACESELELSHSLVFCLCLINKVLAKVFYPSKEY